MGRNTKIEWCDHTFNPWIGCSKVSAGCANCYAETQDKFRHWTPDGWGAGKQRKRTKPENWREPVRWNDLPMALDETKPDHRRSRVFCGSLCDWLDDEVPVEWLADLLALISDTPNLDWLMLSKRPELWIKRVESVYDGWIKGASHSSLVGNWLNGKPPDNVWIGTTVENQEMADKRIPELLRIPAGVRFLSCEPLLGNVDLGLKNINPNNAQPWFKPLIHWCIVGGESGPRARPMHPDWARSLRDQCAAAGVSFFFKQWGECLPSSQMSDDFDTENIEYAFINTDGSLDIVDDTGAFEWGGSGANGEQTFHVGRKAAGRLLDGVEHSEFPKMEVK